jgi:hypothetical protein
MQNLKFGLELEFIANSNQNTTAAQLSQATGIRVYTASYSDTNSAAWRIKTDASLNGSGYGLELVSPILSMQDVKDAIPALCRAIKDNGGIANQSCGFHVHVSGFDGLEFHAQRNIARRFVNFEDTLDLLQPASRRKSNNRFIKSNAALFADLPALWEKVQAITTTRGIVDTFNPNADRYYKLNLTSLTRHGTIELRHHSGTIDAEKIVNWVRFVSHFYTVAAEQTRLWHRPTHRTETAAERFAKMTRGMPADLKRFYAQRMQALNP